MQMFATMGLMLMNRTVVIDLITIKSFLSHIESMTDTVALHSDEKVSARSRIFDAKFDGFWQFHQKVLRLHKSLISHSKALKCGYLEPTGQRARPPNKASMPP